MTFKRVFGEHVHPRLKFLTEVGNKDNDYPPELLENEDTRQAMEIVEVAGLAVSEIEQL